MNNLLSYCELVYSRISASEKYLPVHIDHRTSCHIKFAKTESLLDLYIAYFLLKVQGVSVVVFVRNSKRRAMTSVFYIVPRLICTLIRKSQAPCKIYPNFFWVAKASEIFWGGNLRKRWVS